MLKCGFALINSESKVRAAHHISEFSAYPICGIFLLYYCCYLFFNKRMIDMQADAVQAESQRPDMLQIIKLLLYKQHQLLNMSR